MPSDTPIVTQPGSPCQPGGNGEGSGLTDQEDTASSNQLPPPPPPDMDKLFGYMKQLEEGYKATQEAVTKALSQPTAAKQKITYFPRERKVRRFSAAADSDITAEEFVNEIRGIFDAREFSEPERLDFIVSNIHGLAKDEVEFHRSTGQLSSGQVLDLLLSAFGETRTVTQLQQAFFDLRQKEAETLRNFSHGISALMRKVVEKGMKFSSPDVMCRDQFCENVRDSGLRRELKRYVRDHPSVTFVEVRDEAIRWGEESDKPKARGAASRAVGAREPTQSDPATSELLELGRQQAKALAELTDAVKGLAMARSEPQPVGNSNNGGWSRPSSGGGPRFFPPRMTPDGRPICFGCRQPGHFRRDCMANRSAPNGTPLHP
jgi:hypothetical protein